MRRVDTPVPSLLLIAMFLLGSAFVPLAQAEESEAPESVLFGVEYEWSNLDDDIDAMTGISLTDVLIDVMKAADDAGIELVLAEVTSGSSSVVIEQYDGDTTEWEYDGSTVVLTKRHTDVYVRHGVLVDTAIITEWEDSKASWDIVLSIDTEQLFTADIRYVEYVDADGLLYGMDLELEIDSEQDIDINLVGDISGGGETLPFEVKLDAFINYEISELKSSVRLGEPSPIHNEIDTSYEEIDWECYNGAEPEVYIWEDEWDDYDGKKVVDDCESFSGEFFTESDYSFGLSGIPAGDFGLAADELDISISDSFTDHGLFDEDDIEFEGEIDFGDFIQNVVIDEIGTEVQVREMFGAPFSITMASVVGESVGFALMGSGTTPTMFDALFDEMDFLEDILDGESEEEYEEGNFHCDSGEEIPSHWVNDGFEDCEDGSDEWEDDNEDKFYCDNGYEIPYDWVNNGYDDCGDNSDESDYEEQCYDDNDQPVECEEEVWLEFYVYYDEPEGTWGGMATTSADIGNYTVDWYLYDDEGGLETNGMENLTTDESESGPYGSAYWGGEGLENGSYCMMMVLKDANGTELSSAEDCFHVGTPPPDFWVNEFWYDEYDGEFKTYYEAANLDSSQVYSFDRTINGPDGYYQQEYSSNWVGGVEGTTETYAFEPYGGSMTPGEYCVEVELIDESDETVAMSGICEYIEFDDGEDKFYCDNGNEIPYDWVNNGYDDCGDGSDESDSEDEGCYDDDGNEEACPEPSERLMDIIEAFDESIIGSVMEEFSENLEDRLSNYEEDFAYTDGDARMLWSEDLGMCVGFQIIVKDEDNQWYSLVGPQSDMYADAPVSIGVVYLIGATAEDEIVLMETEDSLDDLVDESEHDVTNIFEALRDAGAPDPDDPDATKKDDADEIASKGGFVPFVSPLASIAMLALAGLVLSRRRKEPLV